MQQQQLFAVVDVASTTQLLVLQIFYYYSIILFLFFFPPTEQKMDKKILSINMQQFLSKCCILSLNYSKQIHAFCCQFSPRPAAASLKTGII